MTTPATPASIREHDGNPTTGSSDLFLGWWRQYIDQGPRSQQDPSGRPARRNGDPGVRAKLRRCHVWSDALAIPAAHDLTRRLRVSVDDPRRVIAAFNVARVLAHITAHVPQTLMDRAGAPADGIRTDESRARVSEARYRRLVQADVGDELADMVTRLLAQLNGEVNVAKLGRDLMRWNDQTRVEWAFQYFQKSLATSNAPIAFDAFSTNPSSAE